MSKNKPTRSIVPVAVPEITDEQFLREMRELRAGSLSITGKNVDRLIRIIDNLQLVIVSLTPDVCSTTNSETEVSQEEKAILITNE